MHSTPEGILKAGDIVVKIMEEDQVRVKLKEVYQVLKQDLDFRYRPIKRIAFRANHLRSLILRQRFAVSLIDQLLRGVTVINCDETWINMKDYTRRRWRRRGETNSSNIQDVNPRIALISAIDNHGQCYFSLTQVNTDSEIKVLFLIHLAAKLDIDRPDWRSDTIILIDNASYNTSSYTTKCIRKLGIPVMFSAPYSYDASMIERFFGYFKQSIILDKSQPSGKL
jgi:transposase InsO family protein